ncbi:LysR family transcriptional regulator [Parvibaculum lavamentivorans]|nr:LysR family transcriptional regulator [Parvibaculum lavamentivorans]
MHPNLLDQLLVFETIAENGSFSAAAKELGRTVSAIGYAIGQLEEQLDLTLFDRSGYRPLLTPDGTALLRDAEIITRKTDRFAARAKALRQNTIINATLMFDPFFPLKPLTLALAEFSQRRPQIQFSLQECGSDAIEKHLKDGTAQLGFIGLRDTMPMRNFDGRQITLREIMLMAAPEHPLAQVNDPFPLSDLDNHRQIILSAEAIDATRYNYSVHVTDIWAVNNVELMRQLLVQGVGWGYMARNLVEKDLQAGRLIALSCKDVPDWAIARFAAVWTPSTEPDEVLTELIDLVELRCREAGDAAVIRPAAST